jgi:hypothetical protein
MTTEQRQPTYGEPSPQSPESRPPGREHRDPGAPPAGPGRSAPHAGERVKVVGPPAGPGEMAPGPQPFPHQREWLKLAAEVKRQKAWPESKDEPSVGGMPPKASKAGADKAGEDTPATAKR